MKANNSVGKVQVTNMLKKLFDFKVSSRMKAAKAILLLGMLAAIAIVAAGLVEVMDIAGMKAALGATKLVAGDVFLFLLKKYLGWALLVFAAVLAVYLGIRYQDNKKAA